MAPDEYNRVHRFVEVASGVFHQVDGQEVIVFQPSGPGGVMAMIQDNFPIITFTRLPWYESPDLVLGLLAACLLIFLATLIGWGIAALVRARRRIALPPMVRAARWLAGGAAGVAILFVVGFLYLVIAYFGSGVVIQSGTITLVLTLGLVSAVLSAGALVCAVWVWSKGSPLRLGARLHYTLVALACLAFVWFLATWNLLGYHL